MVVRRSPSGDELDVQELASGSYVGQPLRWDGAEWAPLPDGDALVFAVLLSNAELTIGSPSTLTLQADSTMQLAAADFALDVDATTLLHLNAVAGVALQGVVVNLIDASGLFFLELDSGVARLQGASAAVQCDASGLSLVGVKLGFYNAAPVARPVITGATTQQQVDSLVSALVALGLVTDGR